jgi:hypothetical protein
LSSVGLGAVLVLLGDRLAVEHRMELRLHEAMVIDWGGIRYATKNINGVPFDISANSAL